MLTEFHGRVAASKKGFYLIKPLIDDVPASMLSGGKSRYIRIAQVWWVQRKSGQNQACTDNIELIVRENQHFNSHDELWQAFLNSPSMLTTSAETAMTESGDMFAIDSVNFYTDFEKGKILKQVLDAYPNPPKISGILPSWYRSEDGPNKDNNARYSYGNIV